MKEKEEIKLSKRQAKKEQYFKPLLPHVFLTFSGGFCLVGVFIGT